MTATMDINRERIAATEAVIRPHIRRTPLVEADLADFGLPASPVTFKLEMLQHSGSFKARGAFANLLLRRLPEAGVVAASGGNHGAAVAYAAQRLGIPATIFVPDITSPAKAARIRGYGAKLVIAGSRYADALAASETHVAQTGAMAVHAYDQVETLLGQGSVGMELEQDAPGIDTVLDGCSRRRRPDRWHGSLERRQDAHRGGRARAIADASRRLRGRRADRCAGGRHRRR
ncbi:threonine dehydratase [Bradyrhizobium sp. GM22.5]